MWLWILSFENFKEYNEFLVSLFFFLIQNFIVLSFQIWILDKKSNYFQTCFVTEKRSSLYRHEDDNARGDGHESNSWFVTMKL